MVLPPIVTSTVPVEQWPKPRTKLTTPGLIFSVAMIVRASGIHRRLECGAGTRSLQ